MPTENLGAFKREYDGNGIDASLRLCVNLRVLGLTYCKCTRQIKFHVRIASRDLESTRPCFGTCTSCSKLIASIPVLFLSVMELLEWFTTGTSNINEENQFTYHA